MPRPSDPVRSQRETGPALRPFEVSLPMALLRARETAMQLFRPLLADHDLTEQQWRVLRALTAGDTAADSATSGATIADREERRTMGVTDLAEATFLLPPSLSRILANLEQRGLVDRSIAPDDQRRSLITLTDDGSRLVAAVAPKSEQTYRRIEDAFGADRLASLLAELDDLARLNRKDDQPS